MADTSEDWAIEHVEEQLYDIISLLTYDAKDVKMRGPNVTDAATVGEDEWSEDYDSVEAGERIRAPLSPRLTGNPATFQLQISWTDTNNQRHSGWYKIPHPGRTRPDLRSPKPPGL